MGTDRFCVHKKYKKWTFLGGFWKMISIGKFVSVLESFQVCHFPACKKTFISGTFFLLKNICEQ